MARLKRSHTSKLIGNQRTRQASTSTDLASAAQSIVRSTAKLNIGTDLKKLSNGDLPFLSGIRFGSPSNAGVKSSSSTGSEWTSLLKTASGGAASLIGGGVLESGIGSLISGLASLFSSGEKNETPLVRYSLPDPQQQVTYVTSKGLSLSANAEGSFQSTPFQGAVYKQADIVQAVKNALLTSSSLNDVIAEV